MKRIFLIFLAMSVFLAGFAQDRNRRQERIDRWKNDMKEFRQRSDGDRKEKALNDTLYWYKSSNALENSLFVLEADAVTFKDGTRILVNENVNFISVNGRRGVVQVSPSSFYPGPNGVGGITLDGNVSGVEKSTDRRGNVHYSANVSGIGINAMVEIILYPGSNDAYAIITPNFSSQTVHMEGKIVPFEQSAVMKGMSL